MPRDYRRGAPTDFMNFWKNPENDSLKIILLVAVIALAGFFIYKNMQHSALGGKGLVLSPTTSWYKLTTELGSGHWEAVASSASGAKLVAGDAGTYFTSTGPLRTSIDGGATWVTRATAGAHHWSSIASSADGTKLVAVGADSIIMTSTDSGANWTSRVAPGTTHTWRSVASSTDGTKLALVGAGSDNIYTSIDSGITWTQRVATSPTDWKSITSSADGTKLAAVVLNGNIYTSTNSGVTWTAQAGAGVKSWEAIASSADGTKLVAGTYAGPVVDHGIFTSSDSGVTWTERPSAGNGYWTSITSSADGMNLTAVSMYGNVHASTDGGVTWFQETVDSASTDSSMYFTSIASDSTGERILIGSDGMSGSGGYSYMNTEGVSIVTLPTVSTAAASAIGTTSATLNGKLTGTGGPTSVTVGFKLGTSVFYGTTITSGTTLFLAPALFSVATSPTTTLTCGTLYHFIAFATNSAGTSYGSDMTFTPVCPTTSTVVATTGSESILATHATLDGNLTALGAGVTWVRVGFQYGTSPTVFGSIATVPALRTTTGTYSFTIPAPTGLLTPSTMYYYRAYAQNSLGATVTGSTMSFTTLAH